MTAHLRNNGMLYLIRFNDAEVYFRIVGETLIGPSISPFGPLEQLTLSSVQRYRVLKDSYVSDAHFYFEYSHGR